MSKVVIETTLSCIDVYRPATLCIRNFVQGVPKYALAFYLGMSTEFLSNQK
jgi:hypothetical protein